MSAAVTHMLATDLDGTLVGDAKGLKHLINYYKNLPYEVSLVYITGRHLESAISLIKSEQLPTPKLLVTDVGTSIYQGSNMEQDLEWKQKMKKDWYPRQIREAAKDFPQIKPQQLPDDRRVSFTIEERENEHIVEEFKKALDAEQIPHNFIFSSGRDIDILPAGSGKGEALRFIAGKFADGDTSILVAGDSGNDLEMLTLGYPSVIVANARQELLEVKENANLYRATKTCAGGIHEAWKYFYG
ncbi:HAD-IIB family hydrolase [Oceanobacillus massiliensis]|uniref:HAD-IIB family hydrolase n=2 Tax=Oceanobacillus massiliensis TaxID=1465765 RepID=UPI001F24A6C5|nr:HAD-IIB family hydrolase [Oceanobacillus massiliensis]